MTDTDDIIRLEWHPTRTEMDAYLSREVVMAKEKITRYGQTVVTLHSVATMRQAKAS